MDKCELPPWKMPKWSEDFGDPTEEFHLLRRYTEAILNLIPNSPIQLVEVDDGYMQVEIEHPPGIYIYIMNVDANNSPTGERIGIFANANSEEEEESYVNSPAELAVVVKEFLMRKQHDRR